MNRVIWRERLMFFGLGILAVIAVLFLGGAAVQEPVGRYQISSWVRGQFVGAMIVDTTTGRVKYVDSNSEGKPFEAIP
jgi:hypothetical protein